MTKPIRSTHAGRQRPAGIPEPVPDGLPPVAFSLLQPYDCDDHRRTSNVRCPTSRQFLFRSGLIGQFALPQGLFVFLLGALYARVPLWMPQNQSNSLPRRLAPLGRPKTQLFHFG